MVTESKKRVKAVYSANESVTVRNNGAVTSSVQYSHFQDKLKPVLRGGALVLSFIICHSSRWIQLATFTRNFEKFVCLVPGLV
jgi:hypothetical protein